MKTLLTIALALSATAPAFAGEDTSVRSKAVTYRAAELETPAGEAAVRARIEAAARATCARSGDFTLQARADRLACARAAQAQAFAAIGLTAESKVVAGAAGEHGG